MKLKIDKKKPTKPTNPADELGEAYVKASAEAISANNRKDEANKLIKEYAEKNGTRAGKNKLVSGNKFDVGYQTVPSYFIDQTKAKETLPPKLYASLLADPTIDKAKFERAVDEGRVSRKTAAKLLVEGTAQVRLLVKRRRNNPPA